MKTLKAICTATLLTLSLSVSAFAGDIAAPGAPSVDPTGTCRSGSTTTSTQTSDSTAAISDAEAYLLADSLLAFFSLI